MDGALAGGGGGEAQAGDRRGGARGRSESCSKATTLKKPWREKMKVRVAELDEEYIARME